MSTAHSGPEVGQKEVAPARVQPAPTQAALAAAGRVMPPPMPAWRTACYMLAALLLALTQGLGMNLVAANIPQIQGELGVTTNEAMWLLAVYMAPYASMSLILIKARTQFGLRNFAEVGILIFVIVAILNLYAENFESALVVRFFSGMVAAPLSSLSFLYMLEGLPQAKKLNVGLSLAITSLSLSPIIARLISPPILDMWHWQGLHLTEVALAMMALAAVYLLPLTPQPRARVIQVGDVVSYLFIAVGFGLVAMVATLGRFYWWFEAAWLGWMLAVAIVAITCAAMIELNRSSPLLDVRWLTSTEVLHFTGALLVFRIVLTEQTSGAYGLFQALGLQNGQMAAFYWVILAATVAGGLVCVAVLKPGREHSIHFVALVLLAVGAYMDSRATNLTRPADMYLSQSFIAFAGALFLPPAMAAGLLNALKKGPQYILSFVIVFLTTQSIGGALGGAVVGTFVTGRTRFHYGALIENMKMTDPMVVQRLTQFSGVYGKVTTDPNLMNQQGLMLLNQQITREATVLAYNDAFLGLAVVALCALGGLAIHMGVIAYRKHMIAAAAEPAAA